MENRDGFRRSVTRRRFLGEVWALIGASAEAVSANFAADGGGQSGGGAKYADLGRWALGGEAVSAPTMLKVRCAAVGEQDAGCDYVFLYLSANGQTAVLSPYCTHMGCPVAWVAPLGEFHCPVDESVYDAEGHVLAGPALYPLDRLPWVIKGGHLYVETTRWRRPRFEA